MIKEYFEKNCINMKKWAETRGLEQSTLHRIITGEITGKNNTNGNTRKVFEALLAEGIINELPVGLRDDTEENKAS